MGYNTEFRGSFKISPEPHLEFVKYINKFAEVRHMAIDTDKMIEQAPESENMGKFFTNEYGNEGEFVVYGFGFGLPFINDNKPPKEVPGLWCQWIINEDGELVWDEGEKFYNYIEWLEYLISNFFEPSGYKLNGVVEWRGEDWDDTGLITVTDNQIEVDYK